MSVARRENLVAGVGSLVGMMSRRWLLHRGICIAGKVVHRGMFVAVVLVAVVLTTKLYSSVGIVATAHLHCS